MKCEVCGNDYDKAFTVLRGDERHTFDSFECAIHALAPKCGHCGCHVVGHGVEQDGVIYCCAHCAQHAGATGITDRLDHAQSAERPHADEPDEVQRHDESVVLEASLESFPASDAPAWAGSR